MRNASIKDNVAVCKAYLVKPGASEQFVTFADFLLKKLKLFEHKNKSYDKLSGGMQRRLSLLITLLQTPKILILDQITANVDP